MARVTLNEVTKRYGEVVAVDRISAEIADGEFVTLLGPSGCGKTTTLRMVAGLIELTAGQILFDDQVMNRVPTHKRKIGLAFQSHALFPHMSVSKNIAFGLTNQRTPRATVEAKVQEMLEMIEMQGMGGRMPAQLSGGQQQRVALARMLATDPRVLLFDEPLSALDRNLRDSLKYSILELQRRTRKTAIYVTHDQSEAFAISDRIFVMNRGRVEQTGTQLDIYLRPETEFVANFVGDNNTIAGTVQTIEMNSDGVREVTVDCLGTTVRAMAPPDAAVGEPVSVFIRPEHIEVLPDGRREGQEGVLRGQITQLIFEGPSLRMTIDASGMPLHVSVSGSDRLALLDQADKSVWIELRTLSVVRNPQAN